MIAIAISGKQGAGKSSVSLALRRRLEAEGVGEVLEGKFAGTIYEMHGAIREICLRRGISWPKVKDGRLLQLLGTEWGRGTRGESVWVDDFHRNIPPVQGSSALIVDDMRFENEFDSWDPWGRRALRVRLECPKEVRRARCSQWREDDEHPSEVGLDAYSAAGRFDMTFRSDAMPVGEIVDLIMEAVRPLLGEEAQ